MTMLCATGCRLQASGVTLLSSRDSCIPDVKLWRCDIGPWNGGSEKGKADAQWLQPMALTPQEHLKEDPRQKGPRQQLSLTYGLWRNYRFCFLGRAHEESYKTTITVLKHGGEDEGLCGGMTQFGGNVSSQPTFVATALYR